jgi:solute:Na+ symporter, SSS family
MSTSFRIHAACIDYAILVVYFLTVLGIGFAARRYVKTGLDFFLSGRSLPAWITGLAFISANLGALESAAASTLRATVGWCTGRGSGALWDEAERRER